MDEWFELLPVWAKIIIGFVGSVGFFAILISFGVIGILVGLGFLMNKITFMVKKRKVKSHGRYLINIYKIPPIAKNFEFEDPSMGSLTVLSGKIVKSYGTDRIISSTKTEVKFVNKNGSEQVVKGEYIHIKDYFEDVEFQNEKLDLENKVKKANKKTNKKAAKKYMEELKRKYY